MKMSLLSFHLMVLRQGINPIKLNNIETYMSAEEVLNEYMALFLYTEKDYDF